MKDFNLEKTALVLAGGGITGAVYEIGALRAIDYLLTDRTVNDFDVLVGTSAGALVSAFLANGISPETMLKVLDGSHPELRPVKRKHLFKLDYGDWLSTTGRIPLNVLRTWASYIGHPGDRSLVDLIWSLSESLPPGLYDGLALERYLRQQLVRSGGTNHFDELDKELYIVATDMDNGERAVFGRGYKSDTPISVAVAASSAVPLIYKPVIIDGREYMDGGLRGYASLDIAIESGATLIICVNPMVPFDRSQLDQTARKKHSPGLLSDKGVRLIADQSMRISGYAGLHYHIKQLRRRHPEVDIILIEPRPCDKEMFFYNMMHFAKRLVVARFGFESATLGLEKDYQQYKDILTRHNIPITRRVVIEKLAEMSQSNEDPQVVKKVLEEDADTSLSPTPHQILSDLQRALDRLDDTLNQLHPD